VLLRESEGVKQQSPELTAATRPKQISLRQKDVEESLAQRPRELDAEVRALAGKAGAASPELVAALQAFSDGALTERVAECMAPLAILGGESVADGGRGRRAP
jgi:major vault protein